MKLTLTSTTKIVQLNGVPARVWEGTSEAGVPVMAFITRLAVERDEDTSQFEAELLACATPSNEAALWPSRMVL